ncbi:hypothetical protein KKH18_06995 [bacterium]|nr:hypothetical protein [bacterium]
MSARASRQFHLTSLEVHLNKEQQVVSDVLDTSRFYSLTVGITSDEAISPDRAAIIVEQSVDNQTWFEAMRVGVNMIQNPIPVGNSFQCVYSPIMKFSRVRIVNTAGDFEFTILSAWAEAKT